jgi:hypothetical protein
MATAQTASAIAAPLDQTMFCMTILLLADCLQRRQSYQTSLSAAVTFDLF